MLKLNADHRPLALGLFAALLTLLYGYGIGMAFGLYEEQFKDNLKERGTAVLATTYNGDEAKLKATLDKSWTYLKRAHLHAGALGASALAITLLLAMLPRAGYANALAAALSGLGGLAYSIFWMLAGFAAPALGSTGAAKEAYAILARISTAAIVFGLILTIVLALWATLRPRTT